MKQDAEDEAARMRPLEDEFDDLEKPQRKYMIKNPERVLVRLKVEHTGFTTLNNQRFGSQFVGQVVSSSASRFFSSLSSLQCIIFDVEYIVSLLTAHLRPIPPTFYSSTSVARPKTPKAAVPRGRNVVRRDWMCLSSRRIWSK